MSIGLVERGNGQELERGELRAVNVKVVFGRVRWVELWRGHNPDGAAQRCVPGRCIGISKFKFQVGNPEVVQTTCLEMVGTPEISRRAASRSAIEC
jgi:hypothetical protein